MKRKVMRASRGIDDFRPGVEYRYAMSIGASLMLGWTALLVWADRWSTAACSARSLIPPLAWRTARPLAGRASGG